MKILGAEGLLFTDANNIKALDQISSDYLNVGDCCCAKHNDKFYWYVLEGVTYTEDLPRKVVPKVGGDVNKTWILKGVYLSDVEVDTIYTNNIRPLSGTDYVNLNDVAQLSGDTFVFNNTTEAPFIVNSQVMVENLNSEYWGGQHYSDLDISSLIDTGEQPISEGIDTLSVTFPNTRFTTAYSLFTEVFNVTDPDTAIIQHMVTNKTLTGFTVKLSSATDNNFYRLQWAVLGENIEAEAYNLQDTAGNNLTDTLLNQLQVY